MAGKPRAVPKGEALPLPPERHWTILDIAVAHQLKPGTVRAAIERGELFARKMGKDYRIPDSGYRKWLADSSPRATDGWAPPPSRPMVPLPPVSFFSEGQNG